MNEIISDVTEFFDVRHKNLKTVWENSDELQKRAIITSALYGGVVMTFLCGMASIIF